MITGISDSFGLGITGLTPVSAETATRAGEPQAAATAAIPVKQTERNLRRINKAERKNHAHLEEMISLKSCLSANSTR